MCFYEEFESKERGKATGARKTLVAESESAVAEIEKLQSRQKYNPQTTHKPTTAWSLCS